MNKVMSLSVKMDLLDAAKLLLEHPESFKRFDSVMKSERGKVEDLITIFREAGSTNLESWTKRNIHTRDFTGIFFNKFFETGGRWENTPRIADILARALEGEKISEVEEEKALSFLEDIHRILGSKRLAAVYGD